MKYFKVNKKVIPEKSDFIQEIFFPMLKRLKWIMFCFRFQLYSVHVENHL